MGIAPQPLVPYWPHQQKIPHHRTHQVTINCAERGLLLLRVRDEIRMTIACYQTLYESSIAFGMRKALHSEQSKVHFFSSSFSIWTKALPIFIIVMSCVGARQIHHSRTKICRHTISVDCDKIPRINLFDQKTKRPWRRSRSVLISRTSSQKCGTYWNRLPRWGGNASKQSAATKRGGKRRERNTRPRWDKNQLNTYQESIFPHYFIASFILVWCLTDPLSPLFSLLSPLALSGVSLSTLYFLSPTRSRSWRSTTTNSNASWRKSSRFLPRKCRQSRRSRQPAELLALV